MKKICFLFFVMLGVSPFLLALGSDIPKDSPLLRSTDIELLPITSILNQEERPCGHLFRIRFDQFTKAIDTNFEESNGYSSLSFVDLYKGEYAIVVRCFIKSFSPLLYEQFTMKIITKLQPFSVKTTFAKVSDKFSPNKYFSLNSIKQFITLWSYIRDCYKHQKLVPARILVNEQLYYAEDYVFDDAMNTREIAIKKVNDLKVKMKFHLVLNEETNDWDLEKITFQTPEGELTMKMQGERTLGHYPTTPWYYYPQDNKNDDLNSDTPYNF